MAQPVPNPPPGFDALSVDEKIDYVESLWDSIVERSSIPLPGWHRELLAERMAAYRADPTAGRPWSEVRSELQSKYPALPTR
jgi:putative addiction module component (TIGR02574 family)